MPTLFLLALAFAAQAAGTAPSGRLKGVVIDASGAALSGAAIRSVQDSDAPVLRAKADQGGAFAAANLKPGEYILIASLQGFRALRTRVVIRDGEVADTGRLRLEIASCDAPGMMCDNFGLAPPDRVRARGYLNLKAGCAVNLGAGKTYCPDDANRVGGELTDLSINKDASGVYLAPMHGATVSPPNSPTCPAGGRSEAKVRIDGLGPGDDICLQTHDGRWSHLFFVDDIRKDSRQILLYQVTR